MAGRWDGFQGLPHGWEVRFDSRCGRYYFIDHINKHTSWEDPRLKTAPPPPPHPETLPVEMRAQQENQSLPHHQPPWMSPYLGGRFSSYYPPYGSYNLACMPPYALYGPVYPLQNATNTTRAAGSGICTDDYKYGGSSGADAGTGHDSLTLQKEVGLTEAIEHSQLAIAKISAMFPTVPESHIKDLMKKYHNREAVVISALQVQKHPLATPGPFGTFTPPPMRHFIPTATALMALQSTKASLAAPSTTVTTPSSELKTAITTTISQDKTMTQVTASKSHISTSKTQGTTTTTSNGIAVTSKNIDQSSIFNSKIDRGYRPVYERARGTHLLEEKSRKSPMIGQRGSLERSIGSPHMGRRSFDRCAGSPRLGQSSLERSIGSPYLGRDSPLLSSRASSPHTILEGSPRPATRSTSEFARSQLGSPRMDYRQSPRPSPHSPKIKLRYLKGIFPKVEPTVILDVLTQCNYNVKDASEKMILMGHDMKETVLSPPKLKDRAESKENKAPPKPSPGPSRPKNLSEKHKKKVRNQLTVEYPALTPTIVTMALQSVFYDEIRARQVLNNMAESDRKTQEALATITPKMSRRAESKTVTLSLIGSPPLSRRDGVKPARPTLPRTRINTAWTAAQTVSQGTSTDEDLSFRSEQRTHPSGPNTSLHKGPSECLLLSDYQAWHGPNPDNASGHSKSLAQGPKRALLRGPSGLARGQDPTIRRGPQGLAKGSKFLQGIKKEPCFSTKML